MAKRTKRSTTTSEMIPHGYDDVLVRIGEILESARHVSARSVNAIMTMAYWEIGRRIVEFEQAGEKRAEYGSALLGRLSADLTGRFGRGFSARNLRIMRAFYVEWPIRQTPSAKFAHEPQPSVVEKSQMPSAELPRAQPALPLPWSHYVRLLSVKNTEARAFYEQEALRGGWSIRQLNRQIGSQF